MELNCLNLGRKPRWLCWVRSQQKKPPMRCGLLLELIFDTQSNAVDSPALNSMTGTALPYPPDNYFYYGLDTSNKTIILLPFLFYWMTAIMMGTISKFQGHSSFRHVIPIIMAVSSLKKEMTIYLPSKAYILH